MTDGKVVYEIRGDNSKFQSDVNQTEQIARSKTSAIGGFANAAIIGIGSAVAAVGAGIVTFSKDAIGAGSQFDAAMSQVAATMGTTVDQISELSDFAMDMGATTAFSATEAAQALNYMALAGYDAQTSMSMLPNVLSLAAAGNMSLARASDMVTDAQSALGLSLADTSVLVDKMAKASSKSNTSVEQLGDAILTVGGTAKGLAGGTTELATVLGVLADNGIKGSEGGTALRNVILALSAPTDQAAEALDALGVSAYDADGNMRALPDIFDDLNKSMAGLTQGQKTEVLNTIFNKVDLKSANALLGTTKERFDSLSASIEDASGAAEQMAQTQLDNLAGDITLMKSALEGAKITLSNALTPALRSFVQFGTKEIGKLDNAFKRGGINGFADQLGKSLGKAVTKLTAYVPKFIAVAGKLAVSLISTLLSSLSKNFPKILKAGHELAEKLANGLQTALPQLFSHLGEIIGKLIADTPKLLKYGLQIAAALVQGILDGLPKLMSGVWDGLKGIFSKPISDDVAIVQQQIADLKEEMAGVGKETQDMHDAFADIDADYKMAEYWVGIFEDLKDKTNLTTGEQALLKKAVEELNEILPDTAQIVQDETGKWIGNTKEIYNNIEAMKQRAKADVYFDKIKSDMELLVEKEIELGDEYVTLDSLYTQKKGIETALEGINKQFDTFAADVETVLEQNIKNVFSWKAGTDAMKAYAESIGITSENFVSWADVTQHIVKEQNRLSDELNETNAQIESHETYVQELEGAINSLNAEIDKFGDKAADALREGEKVGAAIGDGFAEGLKGKLPAVRSAAGQLSSTAIGKMKAIAEIHSPSKRARKEVGEQIGKGEALGIEDSIPDVKQASEKLIDAIDFDVPTLGIPSLNLSTDEDSRTSAIIAVLNKYLPRIGAPIVLDTGELVGATVGLYDHELGVLQQRRARYE